MQMHERYPEKYCEKVNKWNGLCDYYESCFVKHIVRKEHVQNKENAAVDIKIPGDLDDVGRLSLSIQRRTENM
jgi:hypothetical protein